MPAPGRTTSQTRADSRQAMPGARLVLNAGSGRDQPETLHPAFRRRPWRQVRLDIDPSVRPDIIASVTDLGGVVPDARFDAVWCSHILEHLYDHEVPRALMEFRRVLKPAGFALLTCPDLEKVAELVVAQDAETVAYMSSAGPISALDMLFGHGRSIARGNEFMAHRTSFTSTRLGRLLLETGFDEVRVAEGGNYDLWALALMPKAKHAEVQACLEGTQQEFLLAKE